MSGTLIFQFVILMGIVLAAAIFGLRWAIVNSTEGAVKRLNAEAEAARTKQAELSAKIKEADEELAKRKSEGEQLAKKMLVEAEEKARQEREKLIAKARTEGEDIITKAHNTKENIRKELEKEMALKAIDFASKVITTILTDQAKGVLSEHLITEFIQGLEKVDMSRLGPDVNTADIISASAIDQKYQEKINAVLAQKLKRPVKTNFAVDPKVIGGAVLKFGSLALDGSIQNLIKETAVSFKQKVEVHGGG